MEKTSNNIFRRFLKTFLRVIKRFWNFLKVEVKKPSFWLHVALFCALLAFLIVPIIYLIANLNSADLDFIFSNDNFYKSIRNSLIYTSVATVISVVLAIICAYFLSRIHIKGKRWIVLLLTASMLIPTLSIGSGVKILFKANGFMDHFFGLKFDGLGFFDLIVGSVVFSFPIAFLLIYDAFLYEDKSLYDAANTMGVKRISTFFHITLPYLKKAIISAVFASFTLIFADYGLPMEVQGGQIQTLPMFLYDQLSVYNYERSAVISLALLAPAFIAFIVDIFNKDSSDGVARKETIRPSKLFNYGGLAFVIFVGVLLFIPSLCFILLSFLKDTQQGDYSFTLEHYSGAASSSLMDFALNSFIISLLVGIIGTIVCYIAGYATTRTSVRFKQPVHLLSISTLAIPGLVLGIGYQNLFKGTLGWFAGTITILIVVNIIHYFSSPYLMARNACEKINKNYETVGDTLGISRISLFFKVMIPNTLGTIFQMFSYFFINSMITISAVSILCAASPAIRPLSVAITNYESHNQLGRAAVVSTLIFFINLIVKVGFDFLTKYVVKITKGKAEKDMELNRFQFNVLTYIEDHNKQVLTQRRIADGVTLSLGTTNKIINQFIEDDLIVIHSDKTVEITEKGYKVLEPYKVRKAIVIAAGFGSRMAPVTLDTPKPLVKVNGVRIIDTLLDALIAKGIDNITLVVGYKKEQFEQLLEKYPTLKFIENPIYNESNNISSVYAAKDIIDRCYICEADLVVANPKVITKYQYCSNYLGAYVTETDDWCFFKKGNYINKVAIGGENCWHMIGISYWDEKDSAKLREDVAKVFHSRGGKEKYWDNVPLTVCKHDFKVEVRDCKKKDVTEIDNFSELVIIDPSYANYKR